MGYSINGFLKLTCKIWIALEAKEEKQHHKEMLRRIQEEYDGWHYEIRGGGDTISNYILFLLIIVMMFSGLGF